MSFFAHGFNGVRNEYLIARISYGIKYKKRDYWSIKSVIQNNSLNATKNGNSFEFTLEKDVFFKALYCEIELFTTKAQAQYKAIVMSRTYSGCWAYVTLYYFLYFNCTILLRNFHRGLTYFDASSAKNLSNVISAYTATPVIFPSGNYYFSVTVDQYNKIVLSLTAQPDTHKSTWLQIPRIMREINTYALYEEKDIYDGFLSIFSTMQENYPSALRNELNYQANSEFYELNYVINSGPLLPVDEIFYKNFMSLVNKPPRQRIADLTQYKINCSIYLASFLHELNSTFHKEYLLRSNFGKDFMRQRQSLSV